MKLTKKLLDKIKKEKFYIKLNHWAKRNPDSEAIDLMRKGYIKGRLEDMKGKKDLSKQWKELE